MPQKRLNVKKLYDRVARESGEGIGEVSKICLAMLRELAMEFERDQAAVVGTLRRYAR